MRLFTGIDLPVEVRENLGVLLGRLRPTARLKWSPVANFHVTTKFIGEWPQSGLRELISALGSLPAPPRFRSVNGQWTMDNRQFASGRGPST